MPYLPIDPADLGRQYEPIIRINSQSGKGGVAYILENEYGYDIPKEMRKDVGYYIKNKSDKLHRELTNQEIYEAFIEEYQNRNEFIKVDSYNVENNENGTNIKINFNINGENVEKTAYGNGPIDATINILKNMGYNFNFIDYVQQSSKNNKEKSEAITYINISQSENKIIWAVGKDEDVVKSSLLGIVSAINKIKRE